MTMPALDGSQMKTMNEARIRQRRFTPRTLLLAVAAALGVSALACGPAPTPAEREARTIGGVRQLTRDYADATDAAFSPDGQWVAFRAIPRGEETAQLFLARVLEGSGLPGLGVPIRVTPPGSRSSTPTFSPDGRTFLFASTAPADGESPPAGAFPTLDFDRLADLFRVDGWQRDLAAADPRAGVNFARRKVAARPGYDAEPAFTPDGRFVLFASDRDAPAAATDTHEFVDIYAMTSDGDGVVRLTDADGYDGSPAVGPDGRRVVFRSDRASPGRSDLYEMTLRFDGGGGISGASSARRLTFDEGVGPPALTADGEAVVYSSDRDDRGDAGNRELRLLRLAPAGRGVRLTFDPAVDEFPQLSRDGRWLIFSSTRAGGSVRQLFVARFDGP